VVNSYGLRENDYSEIIKEHAEAFRAILNFKHIENDSLSLDELCALYYKPQRRGAMAILCFEHVEENIYRYVYSCIAPLSGRASSALYKIEDGKAIFHKMELFIRA